KVAGRIDIEVDDRFAVRLVEGRQLMERAVGDDPVPFRAGEIERLGRQRPVGAGVTGLGAGAVLEIVGDRLEGRLERSAVMWVADDDVVVGEMVEQSGELLFEQWQPM